MYGKLFAQMYDGTLVGDWKALVTFQQMIVLCDSDGVVDMTPMALSNRTGIPLEVIEHGIKALEEPDQYSRTPDCEGRRITRLDDHRNWGWSIVNHEKYKALRAQEEVREQNRIRKQNQRKREKNINENNDIDERDTSVTERDTCDSSAMSRHTYIDTDKETNLSDSTNQDNKPKSEKLDWATEQKIIDLYHKYLPELTKVSVSRWKVSKHSVQLKARWKEDPKFRNGTFWINFFKIVRTNPWWMGEPNKAGDSFDNCKLSWLVKRENFDKVLELGGFD